ncbi:MAG: hypothetical protein CMN87_10100 [Stappia sp.]|uniref:DUF2125 domain-containing protein n=1 Tax=Stappia sp. TaxID=1870903 RepID=UPI000C42D828|nr:DUF2125 domain-containing protein [Stappia sp.]MAA99564.1 hypothetical protein [Stappia sp.]MBM20351.1 hypothetical protein [Stappia sp.]
MTDPKTEDGPAPDSGKAPARKSRSPRRRYVWLAVIALVVIGLWSTYWAIARGMAQDLLHNAVAVARANGQEIACGRESLSGFPFHFELSCAPLGLDDGQGRTLEAEGFRAVALAYDPRHVILEADAPLTVSGVSPAGLPGRDLLATWQNARASAHFGDTGIDRAAMELSAPQILLAEGAEDPAPIALIAAQDAQVHLRAAPDGSGDADIAVSGSEVALPAFNMPLEMALVARLDEGTRLLDGSGADLAALLSRPDALKVTSIDVTGEGFALRASGTLSLDEKRRLQGELPLTVTGADRLPALLAPLFPEGSNASVALAGAIMAFGRPAELDGEQAVTVPLAFRDGVARVGLIPIAPLRPVM